MKVGFIWQGSSDKKVFEHWNDGLRAAMRIVEQRHKVTYIEPWDDIEPYDVLLYWEAPCTANGTNAEHYNKVRFSDKKKILLFAGGPIEFNTTPGFDLYLVESELNEREMEALGLPWQRAFGVNTDIFFPMDEEKTIDGIHHATCASWKRQPLLAQALGNKAVIVGRNQESDPMPFVESKQFGATVIEELPYEGVALLLNRSKALVQTSSYWGGGQRATLEAMACGVPVICMADSPKNREFVEESGFGVVVEPTPGAIRDAIGRVEWMDKSVGVEYINSKWTHKHYAQNILKAIDTVCQ